ncbi:unnamed protein product [Schistosoma mattheei]|uniref:Uncharacterized protein n=1 Tax=Schistosoma mattheei TaxID=31246 RepID=A0A3P8HE46_9TREM|nr:unnamed protein product [Schistosoma mattheei]
MEYHHHLHQDLIHQEYHHYHHLRLRGLIIHPYLNLVFCRFFHHYPNHYQYDLEFHHNLYRLDRLNRHLTSWLLVVQYEVLTNIFTIALMNRSKLGHC